MSIHKLEKSFRATTESTLQQNIVEYLKKIKEVRFSRLSREYSRLYGRRKKHNNRRITDNTKATECSGAEVRIYQLTDSITGTLFVT